MKIQLVIWVFSLIVSNVTDSNGQVPELSRISVSGNKFVTAENKVIVFQGLCTSDPLKLAKEGRWNQAYFQEMKAWGANITRFAIHPTSWREKGKDDYIKLLDQGIGWAREAGMYVILDWHSIGNLKTEMYQNASYKTTQKETFDFWQTMAQQYKNNTTVAFFELFNEPTLDNGKHGECSWAEWKSLIEEMIGIIRSQGATTIALVGGFNWAYDLKPVATDPIHAEGIAYVSHPYPMKRNKPWEHQWTEDWGFVAEKYPLFLTEIGFCGPDDRGAHIPVISDESYGDAITQYCSERGISYTVWVFDPHWSPMLITDWNFTPSRQGKYFKNALLKK